MHRLQRPEAVGLYDPNFEHDNCGIGAVACLTGNASHRTVQRALDVLNHLEHRGATGAELETGDGAGILLQTPHDLFEEVTDFELPPPGRYAAGMVFLPKEPGLRGRIEKTIEQAIEQHGQTLLGWRDVPVDHDVPGASAAAVEPTIRQVFIGAAKSLHEDQDAFERKLYVIRRQIEKQVGNDIAIPSFSSRTHVYKGMLKSPQLREYYPDLLNPLIKSQLALVHSRFSTNTFP